MLLLFDCMPFRCICCSVAKRELLEALKLAKNSAAIVECYATWCGPCHEVTPIFEVMRRIYTVSNVDLRLLGKIRMLIYSSLVNFQTHIQINRYMDG